MTKNQVIEKLFTGKNFNDCLNKMQPEHLRDDLKMEVALIVCEWPEEKILKLELDKALEFYVVRVILNLIKSKTSPFAKMYRQTYTPLSIVDHSGKTFGKFYNNSGHHKWHSDAVSQIEYGIYLSEDKTTIKERERKEQIEDLAIAEIDNLYWYDAEMIRLYLKHGNFRALETETGIPFISCYKNIKKSLATLKKKATGINKPLFTKEEKNFIQNNKPCRDI